MKRLFAIGIVLLSLMGCGSSAFGVQSFVAGWGEKLIGPLMLLVGLFMLFGHRLKLKGFSLLSLPLLRHCRS